MELKRSHSPIFWLLFGAGGMLAALLGPALVIVTAFTPEALTYREAASFAHHALAKLFLFAVVSLFAWHAVHRILCSLHDVGIRKTFGVKLACYGVAMAITVVAAAALLSV
ncbi:MAG TPA: fumarate reductase subunit FrdD [Ramlibacter sp.]|uniref:fumarate reductase subunit FrdD n=1 Tax=Ramlibacter sp. TaxID=1917967 RepID=UPI002CBF36FA|nr:fumarate reductase subunit FrdD [Ramlibacter sp.]HVZ43421.1 fumarate reductase subunit FrdD [Ramlibacter sp.]